MKALGVLRQDNTQFLSSKMMLKRKKESLRKDGKMTKFKYKLQQRTIITEFTILDDLTGYQLMSIWGVSVIAGWLGSQVLASTGVLGANTTLGIITLWLVGASVPIVSSYLWTQSHSFEWILAVWPAAGVTGILLNYAVALEYISLPLTVVYGAFWFAAIGAGFLATVYYVDDWTRKLYGASGSSYLLVLQYSFDFTISSSSGSWINSSPLYTYSVSPAPVLPVIVTSPDM